jgi:Fic family protein
MSLARAVQASNSIEGYNASLDDVVAAVDGEATLDADEETQLAVEGYRDAMTYVLQLAQDDDANVDEGLLKSLHFMMLKHDLAKNPGRWRPGAIFVRREDSGEIVYEGPEAERVQDLITLLLEQLADESVPVLLRASMAHLNLVMIHPFSDGNGRMARCLQSLVLARERILSPAFSSVEEYLGRNTPDYYEVLEAVGKGTWNPENDARPWVRFCLTAHYRQARTIFRRIRESEELWILCSGIAERSRLPERCVGALCDAAFGLRVRRATYLKNVEITWGEQISNLSASRDLKAIVDAGLFEPVGDKRGRYYLGAAELRDLWAGIRAGRPPRDDEDPFALAERVSADQLVLALDA